MPMNKADRDALMKITPDLRDNPTLVMDLLPRLNHVLTQSDIKRVEYRANTDGWEWAANDLLMFYQMHAKDLNPMIEALKAVKMDELADKISNISLASAAVAASSYKDGEEEFKRFLSSIQSHVRDKYISSYAKLRPLPQVDRQFDIRKIWVNLQFENRTELKDPEDYRACMLSAFEENRLLLVKGHQGSGKTTALRRIAFDWANGDLDKFDLVLVARYRDMENDTEDVIDLAIQWMKDKEYITAGHEEFLQQHKNKLLSTKADRLLLLIDGLDEATIKCTTLDKALQSQDAAGFNYHVLVVSRPRTIDEKVQCPSPIAFILPWSYEYLVEYIRTHFLQCVKEGGLPDFAAHERAQQNTYAVLDFLATHPHREQLARVPLHITFMCLLQEDGALEPGMSSSLLHRKLCYALVQRQVTPSNAPLYPELLDAFQGEFGTATQCPAVRNVALLAFEAMVKPVGVKRIFSFNDLKEKEIDIEMFLKVGFLQADNEGHWITYEFTHCSLQYYFAADLLLGEFINMPQLEIYQNPFLRFNDNSFYGLGRFIRGFFRLAVGITNRFWHENDNPFAFLTKPFPNRLYCGDYKLANEKMLDEYPVPKELLQCAKLSSLEPMMCYLIEMALEEVVRRDTKLTNSIAAFIAAWGKNHDQSIGEDVYMLELLLRLGNQCDGFAKKCSEAVLVPFAIFFHHHSARSVLSLADIVSVARVHDHGIMFEDMNIVVFSSQPIYSHIARVEFENSNSITGIGLCLLEEGTFEYLAQTCRRMGWKEIHTLQADIGGRTELQTMSLTVIDPAIKIETIELDFKRPTHSIIVTPIIQQILSFATIELIQLKSASINDLSSALSDQRLKDTIVKVVLFKISFQNDDDIMKIGSTLSSFTCLAMFNMLGCVLSGSQLINLLSQLKLSSTCHELRLCSMACLQENITFRQFCSLLSSDPTWSKIRRLWLDHNNFSLEQIGQLIQATKSLKLTLLYVCKIPNLRKDHVNALKSNNPELNVVTD